MATIFALVVMTFAGVAYRLVELQAISPDRYVAHSADQSIKTVTLPAARGSIVDRTGYELALSIPRESIYTDPDEVRDAPGVASALAPVLGRDPGELEAILTSDNRFGYLARQVTPELAEEVRGLGLTGVFFVDEPKRFTPAGDLAHGLVGLTDIDNIGISGLELLYDDVLTGTPGSLTLESDPEGRTIPTGEREYTAPVPGDGIMLTIDRSLQYEAEQAMLRQLETHSAEAAMVVMSDPRTGELLAMASTERDPETGEGRVSATNKILTTVYEPGSVMKIVGMSGALEDGAIGYDQCINAPDSISIGGGNFTEYSPHGGGCWPLEDVIINSSNTASINIALALGPERLHHYFDSFGFGRPSGLEFPDEQSGVLRPVEEWWGSSIGSMPIGQGISVTPVQMLTAYNTIANGGVYHPPVLVAGTLDNGGVVVPLDRPAPRRVVSEQTAGTVRAMLMEVVSRGTARTAEVEGYVAAGKTGTALMPAPDGGYVFPDGRKHYMATFCGFIPADDPQVSMCIVTQDPTGDVYTGGSTSGPVFAELAAFAVDHLQIEPTGFELAPEDQGPPTPIWTEEPAPEVFDPLGDPPDGRVRAVAAIDPALVPVPTTTIP